MSGSDSEKEMPCIKDRARFEMLMKMKSASTSRIRGPGAKLMGGESDAPMRWTSESDLGVKFRRRSAVIRNISQRSKNKNQPAQKDEEKSTDGSQKEDGKTESRKSFHARKLRRYSAVIRNIRRRTTLKVQNDQKKMIYDELSCESEEDEVKDQNVLHLACQVYPTVEAIEKIVADAPELVSQRNSMGQTPLHVAASHGSSPRVIEYLLGLDSDTARIQDKDGRTPLHLACSCKKLFDSGHGHTSAPRDLRKGPSYAVIKSLCHAAPDTVNTEDNHRVCALEYAICSLTKPKVLSVLHNISEQEWRGGSTDEGVGLRRLSLLDVARNFSNDCPLSRCGRDPTVPLDRLPPRDALVTSRMLGSSRSLRSETCGRSFSIPRTVNV